MPKKSKSVSSVDPEKIASWEVVIARTLAGLRDKAAMNQQGLADTIGRARGTIYHLENDIDGVAVGVMVRVLLALDVDIWSMFGGKSSARPVRIEQQALRDLVDEIATRGAPETISSVRILLQSFVAGLPSKPFGKSAK